MELNMEQDATQDKDYKPLRQQGCRKGTFVFVRGRVSQGRRIYLPEGLGYTGGGITRLC